MSNYLNEAFKALTLLEDIDDDKIKDEKSKSFNIGEADAFDNALEFRDNDEAEIDSLTVIDVDSEAEEDMPDSYVGQVILECNVCHSLIYKNPEDIYDCENDDDSVCMEEECPFCMSMDGYKIVGQVVDYDPDANFDEEEPTEDEIPDEDVEDIEDEDDGKEKNESLKEELKSAEITTDSDSFRVETTEDGGVTISSQPREDVDVDMGEMIAPLKPETQSAIDRGIADEDEDELGDMSLTPDEKDSLIEPVESEEEVMPKKNGDEEGNFDVEDFEEKEFDSEFEESLKSRFDNVKSYVTESVSLVRGRLLVEGVITFNSGARKKTSFEFRPHKATKSGKVSFRGINRQMQERYSLRGNIIKKKLITESIKFIPKRGRR